MENKIVTRDITLQVDIEVPSNYSEDDIYNVFNEIDYTFVSTVENTRVVNTDMMEIN